MNGDVSVILYSTGCPKCGVLKKKLDAKNVVYKEETSVDVILSMGITNVPVLGINGKLMDFSDAVKWINELEV